MPLYLHLLLLLLISLSIPVSLCSPFSSFSVSTTGNKTIVCALESHPMLSNASDLVCRSYPGREQINYSYEGEGGYGSPGANWVQYSALATGDDFLCGIKTTTGPGSKTSMLWWSFDDESFQEPGDKKRVYWDTPLLALSAGDSHVCGLISGSGSLRCWRWDELDVPDDISFVALAVGGEFVCAITACSGMIRCFGNEIDVVGKEPTDSGYKVLAAGSHHACAVNGSGNLNCWGSGAPEMDSIPNDLVALSLGTNITCILDSNGTVKCWGRGITPPKGMQFVSIEVKGDSVCGVLKTNFSVICWGSKHFENSSSLVYNHVLPGTCAPEISCLCGELPGSANSCSDEGYVICNSCPIHLSTGIAINIPPPPANSPPASPVKNSQKMTTVEIIGIASAVLVSSVVMAGFVLYKVGKKKERINPTSMIELPTNPDRSPTPLLPRNGFVSEQFTFRSLHRATDGFADGNKIGQGGFGIVFWGVLPDGRQAAIKRAHQRRRSHAESAFLSELMLLSRLNHKNLVGLIGFCEERGERILVVEYMQNGTLYDHLHRLPPSDSSPLFTSWTARLKIALDAARGIEYLHSYAVPGIIHRDIKSSNILLDGTWTAKVADFGLSLATTTSRGASPVSAGTVGYMDPEYYRRQELTAKSDVYSFGVVLLEIITGHKAVFKMDEDEEPQNLADYVTFMMSSGDTRSIFDTRVCVRDEREEEAVNIVVKLAAQCVQSRGRSRPVMKEVVMELEWALGLCTGDEEEMVEVVLEVDERGSTVSSMSAYDFE